MTARRRRRWPRWYWDPDAADELFAEEGTSAREVEWGCRLKRGRFDELADNGWMPNLWEFRRIAEFLDIDMLDLYEAVMAADEPEAEAVEDGIVEDEG